MPYLTLNSPRFGGRRRSRPARCLPSSAPVAMTLLLFATSLMAWHGFAGRSSDGTARAAERPPRYGALMANGSRLGGLQLSQSAPPVNDWQLDKQPLLGDDNPLRWLRDRTLAPGSPPAAFVELVTGDRLPGTVVGFVDGARNPFDSDPPHFVVRAETTLVPPLPQREPLVRVVSRFVRRLVWQRRETEQLAPSTLFYRDGRQLTFRAIRYNESGVSLLVADGQRKVAYSEIAEVHLPAVDGWDAYLDELSALCPSGTGRLLQLETVDGLIATTSRDRLRLSAPGGPQDGTRWVQGVQPAWSLDVLWVPQASCWIVRSFGANEVPLSRIVPDAARYKAWLTGVGPPARVNRNVQQGLLRSGGLEFGWGLGVHASTQLVFKLPSYATTFHSWVGLDRLSGRGGCIRARVLMEGQAAPLFDSGFLVGSEVVSETGHVILPAGDSRKLVLDIDAAHEGRPAGADPFDIRDVADWLEPIVQLDASALAAELAPRVQRHMSAWQGWTVRVQPRPQVERGSLEWSTVWDEGAPSPGRFLLGAAAKDGTLELEREFSVTADEPWLVVATSQLAATSPPQQLEVAVDGQPIAESNLVLRTAGQRDPPPLIVPLADYAGRKIRVTLRLLAAPWTPPAPPTQPPPPKPAVPSVSPPCVWRLAKTTEQLPTLYRVFEDAGSFVPSGRPKLIDTDRYAGSRSVELPAGEQFRLDAKTPVAIREQPQWGEYRYVRFVVKKEGEGRFGFEVLPAEARERAARLDGGLGEPVGGAATRIYQAKLPDAWLALPHDLYGSFGRMDVTGILLGAPDGNRVRFDSIYFARTLADFDLIPQLNSLPVAPEAARQQAVTAATQRAAPSKLMIEHAGGAKSVGMIITADGDVLTSAGPVTSLNQAVKLQLADGRNVGGQVVGFCRRLDVALVKIGEPGTWPAVDLFVAPTLPPDIPYVQLPASVGAGRAVMLRRQFRGTIWTAGDDKELTVGSPLLDPTGRLAGLASRSHGGGWLFARVTEVAPILAALRKGEVP